jgi:hypothetical protein
MDKIIIYPEHVGYSEVFKPYGSRDDVPSDDNVPDPVGKAWQTATVAALARTDRPVSVDRRL